MSCLRQKTQGGPAREVRARVFFFFAVLVFFCFFFFFLARESGHDQSYIMDDPWNSYDRFEC